MITLDKNYYIEADSNNWTLRYKSDPFEKVVKGEKKMVSSKDRWYFANLGGCLNRYVNEATKHCKSVDEILSKLDRVEEIIRQVK